MDGYLKIKIQEIYYPSVMAYPESTAWALYSSSGSIINDNNSPQYLSFAKKKWVFPPVYNKTIRLHDTHKECHAAFKFKR